MPSVSRSQQRLFGAVHACQKTGRCASSKIKEIAKKISQKDAKDFAKTKHKGLPKHKKFKEWIENNHPEFSFDENILGALGNIALGAAAVVKTAAKSKNSYRPSIRDQLASMRGMDNSNKTYNYTNSFINQKWNWNKIVNYPINMGELKNGIISFWYYNPTGKEVIKDKNDFIPVNFLDYLKLKNHLSKENDGDPNANPPIPPSKEPDINIGIKNLMRNKEYWHDVNINKFYTAIEQLKLKPSDLGGTDVRQNNQK